MDRTPSFRIRRRTVALSALSALGILGVNGCEVGPVPTPPVPVLPDAWTDRVPGVTVAESADPAAWWEAFGDPTLDELVSTAAERNLDLRIASSRIREARAVHGIAAADLFPSLEAVGDTYLFDGTRPSAAQLSAPDRYYTASLDLGWEIDLWGRVRRSVEAAEYEIAATIEDRRDVLVSIRAEVARSYVEVRSLQGQLASLDRTIASRMETLELVESRWRRGASTELEVARSRAQLAAATADRPPLLGSIADACDRISVLLGESAGPLRDRLAIDEASGVPVPPATIAVGIPADVVRRRADVRAAERTLLAAAARVGVAEASLLPALRITGSGGFSGTSVDELFQKDNLGGVLGIDFSWPIFTAGRLQDAVEVRDEQSLQALLAWERTVLQAIAEVESALAAYAATLEERTRVEETVASYRVAENLARERYAAGVDDLQQLLAIERETLAATQRLAVLEGQVASNVVGLYKALGGGWQVDPEARPSEPVEEPLVEARG